MRSSSGAAEEPCACCAATGAGVRYCSSARDPEPISRGSGRTKRLRLRWRSGFGSGGRQPSRFAGSATMSRAGSTGPSSPIRMGAISSRSRESCTRRSRSAGTFSSTATSTTTTFSAQATGISRSTRRPCSVSRSTTFHRSSATRSRTVWRSQPPSADWRRSRQQGSMRTGCVRGLSFAARISAQTSTRLGRCARSSVGDGARGQRVSVLPLLPRGVVRDRTTT